MPVHGTCVAVDGIGVLIRGGSGSGKSDLALRLIDGGAVLIADDQVVLSPRQDRLFAAAPPALAGRMEVRGLGIVTVQTAAEAELGLVVELVSPGAVERMPKVDGWDHAGIRIPLIRLTPFEASTAAKVRLAVRASTCSNIAPP
jgi:serine kinase of HPr protein (carbohydrate metabolism regulator)